jgi:hypothetical protein
MNPDGGIMDAFELALRQSLLAVAPSGDIYYTRKPSPLAMVHQLARWWDSGYARIFSS